MKRILFFLITGISYLVEACTGNTALTDNSVRPLKDTIGFAQYSWQMDSIMSRLARTGWKRSMSQEAKFVICPHDDYTYVGKLYPELLQHVTAKTIILLGVAHSAARMGVEDSLVFDSYQYWKGPWKNVRVSSAREDLFDILKNSYAAMNDSLHKVEHSLESMIPYLQYFDRDAEIVPVLVPAMSPKRMEECGKALSEAIMTVADKRKWEWGSDFAIVVTTDAVHYGNEDWGGKDMAFLGCDDAGNIKAVEHEYEIINKSLSGDLTPDKIRQFSSYTLSDTNYREYKWTWCGRYCVPVAMYTAFHLNGGRTLKGDLVGYSTSITSEHLPVDDIGMGRTAIATKCHWVGYASVLYR